ECWKSQEPGPPPPIISHVRRRGHRVCHGPDKLYWLRFLQPDHPCAGRRLHRSLARLGIGFHAPPSDLHNPTEYLLGDGRDRLLLQNLLWNKSDLDSPDHASSHHGRAWTRL